MASRSLPLLFCAAIAAAQQPASIRGRTVDSITGQPLRRVHIRLLSPRSDIFEGSPSWGALSDEEGRFSIASIPPGTYLVQAILPGYFYIPKTKAGPTLAIKAGDQIEDLRLELAVEPDLFRLTVVPMPEDGYIKSLLPNVPLQEWAPTYRFSTDGAVSHIMAPLDLRHGVSGMRLKIVIAPDAGISGKITSEGRAVDHDMAGLMLAPEGKTDPNDMLRASVNQQGEYAFHGLPPGVYRLIGVDAMAGGSDGETSLDKLLQKARRVELKAGEHLAIDLDLSKKGGAGEKR